MLVYNLQVMVKSQMLVFFIDKIFKKALKKKQKIFMVICVKIITVNIVFLVAFNEFGR